MVPISDLVEWLNNIKWRKHKEVTPSAKQLVDEHIRREKIVIEYLMQKDECSPGEAHSASLTEGDDGEQAETILERLSKHVDFSGAGIRESLYLIITSCYCWEFDHELSRFENPWIPLLELIGMGYAVGFDESPDGDRVGLTLSYKGKSELFPII